ncbi:MAG: diguanylate cyclase [Sterolibacterium sp.]|nr:diguanylate cyclase [Sterolibacterium sp.]
MTKAISAVRHYLPTSAYSLKLRILLWVLLFVLVGIWGLAAHVAAVLRADLEQMAADHLAATVDYVVKDIDKKIQLRIEALQEIAATITPEILADSAKLNRLLEQRNISRQLFPIGIFVANRQGVNIAEHPRVEGRLGGSVADRDYFRGIMAGGKLVIGKPIQGRFWKQAISAIALPLHDSSGATAGVLLGAMILSGPELFGQLEQTRIGKTGFFLVVSPKDRLIVSATNKSRILTSLPAHGVNVVVDQRLDEGVESVMVGVNSQGIENLSVSRKLRTTGWITIAGISSEEAFAPIEKLKQRIYFAALLISLALVLVLRYILVRQLTPLTEISSAMRLMSHEEKAFAALPVRRDDEIGQMVESFNGLVEERKRAENIAEQYRTIIQISIEGFWITDVSTRILDANEAVCRMHGYTREELLRLSIHDIEVDESPEEIAAHTREMMETGHVQFEARHRRKDGTIINVEVGVLYVPDLSERLFAFVRDITERKQNEAKLRQAASVFSNSQEGIMITDGQNLIIDVNRAFSHITGYERDEVIGKNPGILGSGRQPPEYYAQMWEALREHDYWRGEIWNRRKNGEVYAEMLAISTVRDTAGELQHYIGIFSDISQLKTHEAELHRIAHYDPLTGVPNRRLLADRLGQAIARARRGGKSLAVCYLDLDGFKPINDKHGHAAGDLLLVEITERLKGVLRAEDTLARLGGDEFVLLFTDLPQHSESYLVFDRVLAAVSTPVLIDHALISVSASIGVTLFPSDDVDADTLLRHADQAMYRAKEAGKNRYHLFDPDHDRQMRAHRYHLQRLRVALENDEFVLHYQPKVDLISGAIIGAEALIRWQHPEQGLLLPGEFLHYLDGSDLEIAVGEWVINSVLKQIVTWNAVGLTFTVEAVEKPDFSATGHHKWHETIRAICHFAD